MKIRETYTVVREYSTNRSLKDFDGHIAHVQDETGEFLYGGSGGNEKITVKIEAKNKNGKWKSLT
jgi:hypothetical protein